MCRTQQARSDTGPSPLPTTVGLWASFSCTTSPMRSLSAPCRTGESRWSAYLTVLYKGILLGAFALCPSSLPSLSLPSVSVWQACYVVSVCASLSGLRIERWLVKVMALVHLSQSSVCSWTVNFCQAQMLVTSDDAFMSKQATLNWLQKPGFWVRIPVLETSTFST